MINGIKRARAFAGRVKTAMRPAGTTHGQALDLTARVLGARDWRTYVATPLHATRDEIAPRLKAEIEAFDVLDVDAVLAKLLPPETPFAGVLAIKARRTPLDLIKQVRRGHAIGYEGPLSSLANEWTIIIHEIDEADPAGGTSQFWHHLYDHDGFVESPIARTYHDIIGSWPSDQTCTMLMEHVLDGKPLTGRAARSRPFREAAESHRQAVATLIPVGSRDEGLEMLGVHAQQQDGETILLTWTQMAHMDVEGSAQSPNMVRAWSLATIAQPGWTLARAAEAPVVAELHLVAIETEGKSDRSLAYWMEAHDGDMDDVQKALRLQFAPAKGHRTFDAWAAQQRAGGQPADVYVIDGFTQGSDHDVVGPALRGAIANVEAGVAGCLPFTHDISAEMTALMVRADGIMHEDGRRARIGEEVAARILELYGPGPYRGPDVMPRVGPAGVVVTSKHAGLDLASMLIGRETLVYDDRRLPSEPTPRRPEGMPNSLLGSQDQVFTATRMANDIIDQVQDKVPGADPEEVVALFAQAVGGACRGKVDPHRLAFDSMTAAGMSSVQAAARLVDLEARTVDDICRITQPDYTGGILVSEEGVIRIDAQHAADRPETDSEERRRDQANERAAIMINRVVHLIEQQVERGYQAELGGVAITRAIEGNDDEEIQESQIDEILDLLLLNAVPVGDAHGMRQRDLANSTGSANARSHSDTSQLGVGTTLERLSTVAALTGVRIGILYEGGQAQSALSLVEQHLEMTPEGYLGIRLAAVEDEVRRRILTASAPATTLS